MGLGRGMVDITAIVRPTILEGGGRSGGVLGGVTWVEAAMIMCGVGVVWVSAQLTLRWSGVSGLETNAHPHAHNAPRCIFRYERHIPSNHVLEFPLHG